MLEAKASSALPGGANHANAVVITNTAPERAENIFCLPVKPGRWNATCIITPEQAKRILDSQPTQRPVAKRHVDALEAEMTAGRFVLTNEALAFDTNGFLFDGQHRLHACFNSGVTITALCCFNEPRSNFDAIGTIVRKRTSVDHLVIAGLLDSKNSHNNTVIAGALRFIWAYDTGLNPVTVHRHGGGEYRAKDAHKVFDNHPSVIEKLQYVSSHHRSHILPRTSMVALCTLMDEADTYAFHRFIHQVMAGENIKSGDPAYTFRESMDIYTNRKAVNAPHAIYRFVHAWNAFVEGRQLKRLPGASYVGTKPTSAYGNEKWLPFPKIAKYVRPSQRGGAE